MFLAVKNSSICDIVADSLTFETFVQRDFQIFGRFSNFWKIFRFLEDFCFLKYFQIFGRFSDFWEIFRFFDFVSFEIFDQSDEKT